MRAFASVFIRVHLWQVFSLHSNSFLTSLSYCITVLIHKADKTPIMAPKPSPSAASLFSVTAGSSEPIYKQLQDQVRRLVAGGQLAPGDELPGVREVAVTLAVNPMTVSKAYSLLEAAGLLERRRGLGMVVAQRHGQSRSISARSELLRPTLEKAALEAAQLEIDAAGALALFDEVLKGNAQ